MNLYAFFDGAFGPIHGGTASYGFLIKDEGLEVIYEGHGRAARGKDASCNVAEYEGLYQAMLYVARNYPKAKVEFNGDSSMVIAQMRGESKAKKGKYIPYYEKSMALAEPFAKSKLWRFRWIQRSLNSEADELAQYDRYEGDIWQKRKRKSI